MLGYRRRQAAPPRGKDAQEMPVGEEGDITRNAADSGDNGLGAPRHVVDRLAPGDAVLPDRPSGSLGLDLVGGAPLVGTVVPLLHRGGHLRSLTETGEFARPPRPLERADQHRGCGPLLQVAAEAASLHLALAIEREVPPARVATAAAPFGLSVAHQEDLLGRGRERLPLHRRHRRELRFRAERRRPPGVRRLTTARRMTAPTKATSVSSMAPPRPVPAMRPGPTWLTTSPPIRAPARPTTMSRRQPRPLPQTRRPARAPAMSPMNRQRVL